MWHTLRRRRAVNGAAPALAGALAAIGLLAVLLSHFTPPARSAAVAAPIVDPTRPTANLAYTVSLQLVTTGLTTPVDVKPAGDGSGRLFVVEQNGLIRVIKNGVLLAQPFLDISAAVSCCGERGLLSVAFDPDYAANGTFYVDYTNTNGHTNIERFVVSNPAADVANVIAATKIMTITQPESNHNGGQLHFGAHDEYLYVSTGDGGGGGDQHGTIGNGQDPGTLLGKMLRLNVRGVPTYTIPPTNPFTQTAGYRPEIWALGLRNPWRFSFDRVTGDVYIADVGQNCWEEINYRPGAQAGGENYGWRVMEGFRPFNVDNFFDCNQAPITPPGLTLPIWAYGRSLGSAVSGGYVYRGQAYPWLQGRYFYADYGSGRIWSLIQSGPGQWSNTEERGPGFRISSFGQDEAGELYVLQYGDPNTPGSGALHRLTAVSPADFSASSKQASSGWVNTGGVLTYTIVIRNSGSPVSKTLRMTDTLPIGLSYLTGSFTATHGTPDAGAAPVLKWQGVMSNTFSVTLTYAALLTTTARATLANNAIIDVGGELLTRSAIVTANGVLNFAPLIRRD